MIWLRPLKNLIRRIDPLLCVSAGALALSAVGCSWILNEPSPSREISLDDPRVSCVQNLSKDLSAYFDGVDIDPSGISSCVESSLVRFGQTTKGQSPNSWSRGEVLAFFDTLMTENEAGSGRLSNQAIVREMFFWKAILVGGQDGRITRAELDLLIQLFGRLHQPLSQLRGLGGILAMRTEPRPGVLTADTAEKLRRALADLSDAVRGTVQLVPNRTESSAAGAVSSSVRWSIIRQSVLLNGTHLLGNEDRLRLAERLKVFLVGGVPNEVANSELVPLIRSGLQLWSDVLTIYYSLAQEPGILKHHSQLTLNTVESLESIVKQAVDAYGGRLPMSVIDGLVDSLEANALMPMKIKSASAKSFLRAVSGKLLYGKSNPDYRKYETELTDRQLVILREMIVNWWDGQRMINAIYQGGSRTRVSVTEVRSRASIAASSPESAVQERNFHQLLRLINSGRPLVRDDSGRLVILPEHKIESYSHQDLSRLNLLRVLFDRGLKGYTRIPSRLRPWPLISSAETQDIFLDVRDVGRDLGIVDIRSLTAGERTFMETNIFLSVSDGDQWLSLAEAIEWFETVASAGVTADQIHSDLLRLGCQFVDRDVFGRERLEIECYRRNLAHVLERRLEHLPIVARTVRSAIANGKFNEFIQSLENASRPLGAFNGPTDSSELRALSPILHYLESVFSRFDQNETGMLEPDEVWKVYPLIQPFIEQMAKNVLNATDSNSTESEKPTEKSSDQKAEEPEANSSGPTYHIGNTTPDWSETATAGGGSRSGSLTDAQQRALFSILVSEGKLPNFANESAWSIVRWTKDLGSKVRVLLRSLKIEVILRTDWIKYTEKASPARILDILGSFQVVGRATKNSKLEKKVGQGLNQWHSEVEKWTPQSAQETLVLLQCAYPASQRLRARLREELPIIQARMKNFKYKGDGDPEIAVRREAASQVKLLVLHDPELKLLCMPF